VNDLESCLLFQSDPIHFAIDILLGVGTIAATLISVYVAYVLNRRETDREVLQNTAQRNEDRLNNLERRHGSEIADTRIAVAPLFDRAGLPQPQYPSR
jgi:hypothetical protein